MSKEPQKLVGDANPVGATQSGLTVFRSNDHKGALHIFVPVDEEDFASDQRSTGVVLLPQLLTLHGDERWYADLVCHDERLFEVFEFLIDDVLSRVSVEDDSLSAIRASLSDWRDLLRRVQGGAPESAVIGLRGELEVLEILVSVAGPSAFECWQGGARDFQGKTAALEVKTTVAQSGSFITVHDLQQMVPPTGMKFAIAHVRLTPNSQAPSVNSLISRLTTRGILRSDLEQHCSKSGWSEEQEEWNKGYESVQLQTWVVDDSFPGLRPDRIESVALHGVTDINYQLDLAAGGRPLDDEDRAKFFSEVCS